MTAVEPVGSQILTGSGPPDPNVGSIGDYWIDTANKFLYGPKAQDTGWGDPTDIGNQAFVNQFDLLGAVDDDTIIYDAGRQVWEARAHRYVHIQDAAASTWTVTHNLGCRPGGIAVVDSGDNVVYGNVEYADLNTVILRFAAPFGGRAYIS